MRNLVAVFVGGLIGTSLRLGIDLAITADFPWATIVVNVVGSFALGYLVARCWPVAPEWVRAGVGVGLLGSFTTFSALTVSLAEQANNGEWMPALLNLAVTLVLGLGGALLGLLLGRPRSRAKAAAS